METRRSKASSSSKRRRHERRLIHSKIAVKKVKLTNYETHSQEPIVLLERLPQLGGSERPQQKETCSKTEVAEKGLPSPLSDLCSELKMMIYNKLEQEEALNMRLVSKREKDAIDNLYSFNIRLDDRKPPEVNEFLLNLRIRQLIPIHFFQPPEALPLFKFPKFLQEYTFGHLDSISPEKANISFQEYIKNCTTSAQFNVSNMEKIVPFPGYCYFSKLKKLHISASEFHTDPLRVALRHYPLNNDVFMKLLKNVKHSTKDLSEIHLTLTINFSDAFQCTGISTMIAYVLGHQTDLKVFKLALTSKRERILNVPRFQFQNENRNHFDMLQPLKNLKEINVSSDNPLLTAFKEMLRELLINQQKLETLKFLTLVKASVTNEFYQIKKIIENNLNTLKYVILRIQKPIEKFLDYISSANFRGLSSIQTVRERVISQTRTFVYYELFFDFSNLKAAVQDSIIYLEIRSLRKKCFNLEKLLTKQFLDERLQNLKLCRILLNQPRPCYALEQDLVSRLFSLPKLLLIFISGRRLLNNQNPEGHSTLVKSSEFSCKLMAFSPSESTWQCWHRLSIHDNFKEVSGPDVIIEFPKLAKKAFRKVFISKK